MFTHTHGTQTHGRMRCLAAALLPEVLNIFLVLEKQDTAFVQLLRPLLSVGPFHAICEARCVSYPAVKRLANFHWSTGYRVRCQHKKTHTHTHRHALFNIRKSYILSFFLPCRALRSVISSERFRATALRPRTRVRTHLRSGAWHRWTGPHVSPHVSTTTHTLFFTLQKNRCTTNKAQLNRYNVVFLFHLSLSLSWRKRPPGSRRRSCSK